MEVGRGEKEYAYGGEKKADALHLWPRKDFMLLAMPNLDKSYSTTLFATEAIFDKLDKAGSKGVRAWFEESFPDAASSMTTLEEDFENNPVGTLTETRCFPYHYTASQESRTLLMGDAAHAMYPFMGQGTNAAFEDVYVLSQLLEEHKGNWTMIAEKFSQARKPNLDALTDMAANHDKTLCEMAFSPARLLRLAIAKLGGERFRPLYSAVAFSAEPYAECIKLEKQRMAQIGQFVGLLSYIAFAVVGIIAWTFFNSKGDTSLAAAAVLGQNSSIAEL
jgi:kynurenine 3-monooxygenase